MDYNRNDEGMLWEGSDDEIRLTFHSWFKLILLDLLDGMHKACLLASRLHAYNNDMLQVEDSNNKRSHNQK